MPEVTITANRRGSFKIEGPIRIIDSAGNEISNDKPVTFLCRCGLSKNKPFCDGAHKAAGFEGGEPHVLAAEITSVG